MSTDSSIANLRGVLKICAACDATVAREDCHRNRYGEYICHACQSRGVRFTWRRRLHVKWRQWRKDHGRSVAWTLMVAATVGAGLLWLSWLLG